VADSAVPTDTFSRRRRELIDNPGVFRSASTVNINDFYGNLETWVVETFRSDVATEVLIQVTTALGGTRIVLPPVVMAAIDRQRGSVTTKARKRAARRAVDTKREKGIAIGNPAALRKARRARAKKGGA
jgi:hypothetical protein